MCPFVAAPGLHLPVPAEQLANARALFDQAYLGIATRPAVDEGHLTDEEIHGWWDKSQQRFEDGYKAR